MQYIIYHQRKHSKCPDGWAAAWIASKVYRGAEIIGWQYQTPPPQFLQAGDEIIIVDFSFKAEIIETWLSNQVKVLLIDHHKTAEEELQRNRRKAPRFIRGDISRATDQREEAIIFVVGL
jgi:oligoribonuclease NrnB/cAMP/cGMP phosphodiesterase (DHH superfamily)